LLPPTPGGVHLPVWSPGPETFGPWFLVLAKVPVVPWHADTHTLSHKQEATDTVQNVKHFGNICLKLLPVSDFGKGFFRGKGIQGESVCFLVAVAAHKKSAGTMQLNQQQHR